MGSPRPDDPGGGRPRPQVMGIVNVTPDSFSDGGRAFPPRAAVEHATSPGPRRGRPARPGRRIDPARLGARLRWTRSCGGCCRSSSSCAGGRQPFPCPSTRPRPRSPSWPWPGGRRSSTMSPRCGETPTWRGWSPSPGPASCSCTCSASPRPCSAIRGIRTWWPRCCGFLAERIAWCEARGIPRCRIAVDPGIGFGKTFEHNLELLRNLERFANLGCALLVGTSRKGFLGTLTGRAVSERMVASAVSSLAAARGWSAGRPGARRGGDGRRDQGLDGGARMGRDAMSHSAIEAAWNEGRDAARRWSWSPCAGRLPSQAKAASRRLALARGAAKNAWLVRSAEALRAQDRTRSSRPTPATWPRPPGSA